MERWEEKKWWWDDKIRKYGNRPQLYLITDNFMLQTDGHDIFSHSQVILVTVLNISELWSFFSGFKNSIYTFHVQSKSKKNKKKNNLYYHLFWSIILMHLCWIKVLLSLIWTQTFDHYFYQMKNRSIWTL